MRGKRAPKRKIQEDAKYGSKIVSKFINYSMIDGKKRIAERNFYNAIEKAAKKLKTEEIDVFEQAIGNVKPKLEVRSRRVGGANYQVPVPVAPERQTSLAMRWIISAARNSKKGRTFSDALATEFLNAYNKEGNAIRKKEETLKMAEANKAFAHFGW